MNTLNNSSIDEQIEAAQEAEHILNQEIEQRRLLYEATDKQDKPFIGYKAGILRAQADWLEIFIKKTEQCLPLHKQASKTCRKYFKKLKTKTSQLLRKKEIKPSLTERLISYARLERERIFSTYSSTLALAVIHEHKDLHPLMAFWSSPRKQWVLLNESKKYLQLPKLQVDLEGITEEAAATAATEKVEEVIENTIQGAIKESTRGGSWCCKRRRRSKFCFSIR